MMSAIVSTRPTRKAVRGAAVADARSRRRHRAARRANRRRRCGRRATARCGATRASSTASTGPLEVPRADWEAAAASLPPPRPRARSDRPRSTFAASRGRRCRAAGARPSRPASCVEQRVIPLDRVGCYVPGGLLSAALVAADDGHSGARGRRGRGRRRLPAARIPPCWRRLSRPASIGCFSVGGAHAIAALAYGTRTIPRVDKIVGPGNQWVSAAKALVSRDCAIDFYAGPTEILIVAASGRARWIAADLIAQAEHDPDARAVLITPNRRLAAEVAAHVERLVPADGPARASLARHGGIIVVSQRRRGDGARQRRRARASGRRDARRWRPGATRRARSSSGPGRRRWPAITPSDRTTCCPRRAPRGFAADSTPPISCGWSRCSASRGAASAPRADRDDAGARRRTAGARRRRSTCGRLT